MSRWEKLFQEHEVHTTIKELSDMIDIVSDNISAEEQIEKRRFKKILTNFKEVLSQLDPEIISFNHLNEINSNLRSDNIYNQIQSYSNNPAAASLTITNDKINNTLLLLSQLFAVAKKSVAEKPIKGLEKLVDEFSTIVATKKEVLEKQIKDLSEVITSQRNRLDDLSNTIEKNKTETNGLLTDWQKQFSEAQSKRNEDFAKNQNARNNEINELLKETTTISIKKIEDLIEGSKTNLDKGQIDFNNSISNYLSSAEEKHTSILELHELVASDSVAGAYEKNAGNEERSANWWRRGVMAFILVTVVWTGFSHNLLPTDTNILIQLLHTFSVATILLFGTAYSAQQSTIHRNNCKNNRKFYLEVKAIDPFIASLKEEDRNALKNELSKRLFGNNIQEKDHNIIDAHAFGMIIKGITSVVKQIKK